MEGKAGRERGRQLRRKLDEWMRKRERERKKRERENLSESKLYPLLSPSKKRRE